MWLEVVCGKCCITFALHRLRRAGDCDITKVDALYNHDGG